VTASALPSLPVILVDGDDPSLVSEALGEVIRDLVGDADRDLVVEDYRGDGVDLAAVADSCATPAFLADRRVAVVREVGRYSTDEVAPLLAYLEDPLPSTVLVLGAGEGSIAPRLLAAVKSKGHVRSTKVAPREAADWLKSRLRSAPVRLDEAAERLVLDHLGEDLGRLGSLLDVLASGFGEGARLSVDDVAPYLGEAGSIAPWDLTDAIDGGRTEDALKNLHRLLRSGERHPLVVLAILHRHVQSLLRVDSPSIRTEAQAAEAMGIAKGRSTFPAKKALSAARRWGSGGIADGIGLIARAELDLKGASALAAEGILEVLVARLCFRARAGRAVGAR
jgi:DNA polymerase-3 subunit delta